MQYGLGIDLGTTQTAAAVRVDGRVEVVRLGGRRAEIPSLVFVKSDGGLLIGEAAERRGQAEPARLAREFKRRMGDPVPILVGGTPFSAHALTAKLLRHVLDTVTGLQDGPPAAVTVTHPANWGPYKREQLDQAIKLADAGPVQLRSEPEAAALQHATARRIASGETVAVYDLGGGTFDVAVLRREGDGFVLLGEPEGVEQLGGIDFDEAVFGHVLEVLGDKAQLDPGDPEAVAALARLRRDCVEAKESLSFDTETMIPVALPGLHTRVRLNRSELESMIAPSLADTVSATQRALRSAGVDPAQLSAFLLAGGSSRIPLVAQLLSTEFQRPVVADPHPEHSIAMGAAVATAVTVGGGSPFAAAVPPPRAAEPTGGNSPVSAPRRDGAATGLSAAAAPASAPVNGGIPVATPAGGSAAVGSPPYGGAAPAGGSPAYGGSAPGGAAAPGPPGGSVAFSRGAATVPGNAPTSGPAFPGATSTMPATGAGAVDAGFGGGAPAVPQQSRPWPPPPLPGPAKRNLGKIVMIAALVVAVLAGGTTAGLILVNKNNKDKETAGTTPTEPTRAASQAAVDPLAVPTDTMLIRVDTPGSAFPDKNSKIYQFTPGQDARTPLPGSGPGDVLPKWSHKRDQIAITHVNGDHSSIDVVNADGGDRHEVADDAGGRVAWSADDSKLAFMKVFDGVNQIAVLNLRTGDLKQLTFAKTLKDDAMWSPDGKSILYWLNKGGIKQIYELNVADPKEPGRPVTGPDVGPANDPVYSPDGSQVLFTRELEGDNPSDIWLVNIDGSSPRRVTSNPEREMDPTWSPDGKWFAFVRGDYAKPTVVVQRLDGTGEKVLTKNGAREGHPCWF
jgi:molecular chaperone DnaK